MKLWNFAHNTLGIHLYVLLTLVVAVLMIVTAIIHVCNTKKREEKNEQPGNPAADASPAGNASAEEG